MDKKAIIKALRDTAQSASNAIASNVSGPVDLIAAGLRGVGLPIPQNPVGGSQWMAERGLTRDVEMGAPRIIGETLGMAGPALAVAKAPQIAAGLNAAADMPMQAAQAAERYAERKVPEVMARGGLPAEMLKGMASNTQSPLTVWHGSPHKFDKFDASKIGTGEGAQAYGHGLYVAESPAVAKEYADKLSSTGGAKNLASQFGGVDEAIAEAQRRIANYKEMIANGGGGMPSRAQGMLRISEKNLEDLTAMKAGLPENTGSLYKIDLPDEHIAKMLDWDKPLSQQSKEVQTSAMNIAGDHMGRLAKTQAAYMPGIKPLDTLTGEEFHRYLSNNDGFLGIQPGAILSGAPGWTNMIVADRLKQQGIPGIRYLDGGSRGAGTGTSNFVVFPGNEHLLQILERNGQPLGLMGIK